MTKDLALIRFHTQRLAGEPFASVLDVVQWFGAIQAQDFGGALWAIGQRSDGLTAGNIHQAIADPDIRPMIERLMQREAAPTIDTARCQDLLVYAADLLDRFANPALHHRLIQIAMDGSQKIPPRWLETLAWHQARGQRCSSIEAAIAAWIAFLRSDHRVDDPLADQRPVPQAQEGHRHGRRRVGG